jgi:hypothetical protein
MPILKKLAATQVAINSIDQMANGSAPTDNKLIDAHLLADYFPAKKIDPYQNPEAAGAVVAKLNTVPTDLKNNMSNRLLNSNDPSGQKVALRFYDSFKQYYNGDDGMVKPHMSDEAKTVYSLIQDQRATAGNDPGALDNVLARVDQGIAKSREYDKIPWTQITGDTHPADAENRARDSLTKALVGSGPWGLFHTSGAFVGSGESPTMDWVTQRNLLQTLKESAVLRSQAGKVDLQGTADEVVNNMWQSGRAELLPGEGGTTMFRLKPDNRSPALSPVSINPATGKPENTLSVFRTDLGALSGAVPGLIDSPSNISVNPMSPRGMDGKAPQGSEGVYWLSRNGDRLQIGLGSKLNIADQVTPEQMNEAAASGISPSPSVKETVVPKDPTEALAFLQKSLPADRGLVLVPNDPTHPTTFYVGYRPHFLGKATPAVSPEQMTEKRAQFQQTQQQLGSGVQQMMNDER